MYDDKEDDVLIEAYRSKYHPNKSVADLENSYAQKLEREEERRRQRELKNKASLVVPRPYRGWWS